MPLADLLRPHSLNNFIGQEHLVGKNKPLRLAIATKQVHSMIFWGPPGCGKTTLARIIANSLGADFHNLSAVSAGKADIKKIVEHLRGDTPLKFIDKSGSSDGEEQRKTIVFLDEIHRFNKAQQDFLLPYVEDGTIILIGATTENPSFEVISPLLSRCHVYVLEPLSTEELSKVIRAGIKHLRLMTPRMVARRDSSEVALEKGAEDFVISYANGDARQALNLLEVTYNLYGKNQPKDTSDGGRLKRSASHDSSEVSKVVTTLDHLKSALQSKFLRYDTAGEEHYNTISAFIKSMRASNVDAALYYLARMVNAGEDPLFIARRMVIFASEDIGMAQPTALVVANEVFQACQVIGYPECQINLAHGVTYLCLAKKDRGAYEAYFRALDDVKKFGNLPIPLNIRNVPTKLMKELGYGKGYEMYPDKSKSLLPEQLRGKKYYK